MQKKSFKATPGRSPLALIHIFAARTRQQTTTTTQQNHVYHQHQVFCCQQDLHQELCLSHSASCCCCCASHMAKAADRVSRPRQLEAVLFRHRYVLEVVHENAHGLLHVHSMLLPWNMPGVKGPACALCNALHAEAVEGSRCAFRTELCLRPRRSGSQVSAEYFSIPTNSTARPDPHPTRTSIHNL